MGRILRNLVIAALLVGTVAVSVLWLLGRGVFGHFDSAIHEPVPIARSSAEIRQAAARQRDASKAVGALAGDRQILFGDLHVHTTISFDAFMLNLPLLGGQGPATPADACDFARHCAGLDFWSINDHASNILPEDWRNTIAAVRQCNALAGDPDNPDLVTFLGWEWTQAGKTPDSHYGHKNVVLAHLEGDKIPTRPIAASMGGTAANPPPVLARGLLAIDSPRFRDLAARWTGLSEAERCPTGNVWELPADCLEVALTPVDLFRKLDEWGHDAIVIPHGTAWGIYTPPIASWDKQLSGAMHDASRQTLIEVYSGHGASEVYRPWRSIGEVVNGSPQCPPKRPDYLPMCQRAGDIVAGRCADVGLDPGECEQRAETARRNAAAAGVSSHVTVVGTAGADWLDAGQCRDCDQPSFSYRPASSAQYISALGNFEDDAALPRRFRMGFISSSDIHSARPGTGYKELRALSESPDRRRPTDGGIAGAFFTAPPESPESRSRTYAEAAAQLSGLQLYESERVRSFLYTGGLVAVHAKGRDRHSIWQALKRKEVYGTSGPRILLWFDLLRGDGSVPMGGEVETRDTPKFRVRALGSLEQEAGCAESTLKALGAERTADLCAGECYRPTDRRRPIVRVEVVRIRPQSSPDEDVAGLIDDPWRVFECDVAEVGCVADFVDDEYPALRRDTVYYARVFETASPTVNGLSAPCASRAGSECDEVDLCREGEECLAPYEQRAWSSPIFVDFGEGDL